MSTDLELKAVPNGRGITLTATLGALFIAAVTAIRRADLDADGIAVAVDLELIQGTPQPAGDLHRVLAPADDTDGAGDHLDFDQATETIQRIKAAADLVIPGHGSLILNLTR